MNYQNKGDFHNTIFLNYSTVTDLAKLHDWATSLYIFILTVKLELTINLFY